MSGEGRIAVRRELAISKSDLVLFDGVAVMGIDELLEDAERLAPHVAADVEYLLTAGFVDDAPASSKDVGQYLDGVLRDERDEWARAADPDQDISLAVRQALRMGSSGRHPASSPERLPAGGELVVAYALRLGGLPATPLLETRPTATDWDRIRGRLALPDDLGSDASLLDVVVNAMPVPGDDVPLEDVLDFARDPETRRRRERLLLALARAELEGRSPDDYALQIRESLFEFDQHMKLADLRSGHGMVRLVLSASLGAVEELIHLRPKGAVDAVLEYRKLRADRMEAELKTPGRRGRLHLRGSSTVLALLDVACATCCASRSA